MIVKVIIKRDVIRGKEKDFFRHLKELRHKAMHQKGYLSGETLICAEATNKVLVISKWESLQDWECWKNNTQRKAIDSAINDCQYKKTVYEPFVFRKFYAAVELGFPPPLQEQRN